MFSQKNTKAFTLIELLVGIAIITIIVLGANNLNFNKINSEQELNIFANKIKTHFESIRNNALSGKGIGVNLDSPEKWKIDYSKTNSGTIITSTIDDGIIWSKYDKLLFKNGIYIAEIRCGELNENESSYDILESTGTGTIFFEGININYDFDSSTTCIKATDKIIEITVKHRTNTQKILFNSVSGLATIK